MGVQNTELIDRIKIYANHSNFIGLSFKEIIFDRFCRKKSSRVKLMDKAETYIKEKISIEHILKKLIEIDKLKFSIFDNEQLKVFHCIPNPNFNEIFNENKDEGLNSLDYLWRKYEFYKRDIEEEKKSIMGIKNSFNPQITINDRLFDFTIGELMNL